MIGYFYVRDRVFQVVYESLPEEDRDLVIWKEFFIVFDHQYIPDSIRQTKQLESIDFHQENMIVAEYEAKFMELGNFVATLDIDDTKNSR